MKKACSLCSILLILIFCVSCSKDDDAPSTIPIVQDDSFFKAKIDGVEYSANGNQAVATVNGTLLTISSVLPDGQNFYLYLNLLLSTTFETGTYTYPNLPGGPSSMNLEYSNGSELFGVGYCVPTDIGEIKIDSLTDEEISGTFSFTAKKSGDCLSAKNITDGSFKLKIN